MTAFEEELEAVLTDKAAAKPKGTALQLVELAKGKYRLLRGADGQPYAVPREGASIAHPLRGEDSFRSMLASQFFSTAGKVANSGALTDALLLLEAFAEVDETTEIYQRVAPLGKGVLIDLGRADHLMVEVTAGKWTVRSGRPGDPLFKRSRTMGPMPVPVQGGSLDSLWPLINVREDDRPLVRAWLAAALLPVAQPILLLRGEQGTGKTVTARMLLTLLDPGPGQMTAPPRTERDWE